ncbi:KR domain-containing protein [Aspergillus venezuelensis]
MARVLATPKQATFHYLRDLFASSHRVLWVTDGVHRESSPFFNIADGLFRVLNSEYDGRTFATLSLENPWNAESDRKLSLETPGLLDSLHFVKDTDRAAPLPDHRMEVKVKAVGVNFRDLLVMLGRIDQTTVGFECAGIVTRVGADCSDFNVGDHVVGCELDIYRSYARLQRDTAVRIPPGISFTDFAAGVKRLTGGQGADVLLNSLSVDLLTASWESIAPYGRFIEIGKRDIMGHAPLDMYYFQRNVSFSAIDVALMVKERPHLVGRALRAIMPLIANGDLRVSSPTSVYGVGELEAALRIMQGGQSSGKVVIEMRDTDMVKSIPSEQAHHYFDPNAICVIAGGLGGLGRGIARWMVSCGAWYLLLLSRSGARDDEAVTALATPCDITNRLMLEAFLGQASHCMPRIKGCIQATMVLKDAMFETMTYEQWTSALAPKVQGTWNLHELLPKGLVFFIMLSSIARTMGNRGQANHTAANSFMDALAHYRTSIGEKATALNMGLFLSVGVAAQSPELQEKYLSRLPFTPVTEGQLHALLAYHCTGQPDLTAQTILGLEATEAQQRKGPDASY